MLSLLKKELNSFFGSITGYLVVSIFLLTTSLFLWVIPGNFNLIEGQRATLKSFFELAPWLYLFLIPALTMRSFAEEKRMGTLEMIITRPISAINIVFAKYLAALLLVIITLAPTLLYFYSIYQLGNPIGNIDTGSTWGSFMGLLLLASVYIGIGLFASSLTTNQVISFLIAIVLSYIMYLGLGFISSIGFSSSIQNIFIKLSINEHYTSISRGVVDSRDILYFLTATLFFLYVCRQILLNRKLVNQITIKNVILFFGFWILAVWFINARFFRLDLTKEKRYSLDQKTITILENQDQPITFEVYLAGDLPAGMKEFQESIVEKIEDLNAYSQKPIHLVVFDIYSIKSQQEQKNAIESLIKSGIQPINFGHKTTEGLSTKQIFPGVIVHGYQKGIAVNLLKNNQLLTADENLQQSIELLEYQFIRAIRYLQQPNKPQIAFLTGHNEATEYETGDFRFTLSENYSVLDVNVDQLAKSDSIETLIVAAPQTAFSERDKLIIDQFIMRGGNVMWCIDPVFVSIDSLSRGYSTIAFDKGLNLRDQLFTYGARINSDILQDAFCLEYPINTAPQGKPTQFTPAPFYYSPLATPNSAHSLSRNMNNVQLEFASSISIVGQSDKHTGSSILTTSPYSRSIQTPVKVSLQSATNPPDQRFFNQANIPIGVLLEGEFNSAFKNRITRDFGYPKIKEKSNKTKQIVIADGDIIKNKVRNRNGQPQIQPLGFDQYSGQTFGNSQFLLSCIDYLHDDFGIMQLRSKVIKLRMLDKVKIRAQKLKWQIINTLIPIILFLIFGLILSFIRRKRFS